MLDVPESMRATLENFVVQLFTGALNDPEQLSIALQSLTMCSLPEAQAARLRRQKYRRAIVDSSLLGDAGWVDRSNVLSFPQNPGS